MKADPDKVAKLKAEFQADLKAGRSTARQLLKDSRLQDLLKSLKSQAPADRRRLGRAVNDLKFFLEGQISKTGKPAEPIERPSLDVTAPWDADQNQPPPLLPAEKGSVHPVFKAQDELLAIFGRMGFTALESRQIDSEFYMFDSLNFPPEHPARDQFDTFLLEEKDENRRPLVAPAHTSTMQNRVLKSHKSSLENGRPIAVVIPGRVFRNEDVDASHDHMFYQLEGIYVDREVAVTNLIATLKEAMSAYFRQEIGLKIQPFYFPFTEPSFEFAISCPFCSAGDCRVCKAGWIELLGCGMIHPNVLEAAGLEAGSYSGFAWGLGLNRLAMLKDGIEDIRHFASGRLEFLQQFRYEN